MTMRDILVVTMILATIMHGHCQNDATRHAATLNWARHFDTDGDENIRKAHADDAQSVYGTIFTRSCFKAGDPASTDGGLATFNDDLKDAFSKIKACARRYPELSGLLQDTVSIMRRNIVTCVPKCGPLADRYGHGGYALLYHNPFDTPTLYGKATGRHASYMNLFYVTITDAFANQDSARRSMTLFHEALHFTATDNLVTDEHARIERIFYDKNRPCAENEFDDRIILLQSLCGFENKSTALYDRTSRCDPQDTGQWRGCVRTLTHVEPPNPWFDATDYRRNYGDLLTIDEARNVCRRVRDAAKTVSNVKASFSVAEAKVAKALEIVQQEKPKIGMAPYYDWTPASRYLASLSKEEKIAIAAKPFDTRGCVIDNNGLARGDASILMCAFSPDNAHYPLTVKIVAAYNQDMRLFKVSDAILTSLARHNAWPTDYSLPAKLRRQTQEAYMTLCPSKPDAYRPPLCHNGKTIILDAIDSAERVWQDINANR